MHASVARTPRIRSPTFGLAAQDRLVASILFSMGMATLLPADGRLRGKAGRHLWLIAGLAEPPPPLGSWPAPTPRRPSLTSVAIDAEKDAGL